MLLEIHLLGERKNLLCLCARNDDNAIPIRCYDIARLNLHAVAHNRNV